MRTRAEPKSVVLLLSMGLLLLGCGGSDGELGQDQNLPPPPPVPKVAVEITALTAYPSVILPGQSTILTVSSTGGDASALKYSWYASEGSLSASDTNPVTWVAPTAEGSYRVVLDVWDGDTAARAQVNLVVAVRATSAVVTSVIPGVAKSGDVIRVIGSGFGDTQGTSTVSIGGATPGLITSWSDSEIQVPVPDAATSGPVKVTVNGVDSSPGQLVVLWGRESPENVSIVTSGGNQVSPVVASDGQGGAIFAWVDYRTGEADIYAQRVDARGVALWGSGGVVISAALHAQLNPKIITDGASGAIVVWEDYRSDSNYDLYAQRIEASGAVKWVADGVAIAAATGDQLSPRLVPSGANGAIIVWQDERVGGNHDIYAQRIDADGVVAWATDGVAVSTAASHQFSPTLATDGSDGAIIVWEDYRSGSHYDVYAQRLDSAGAPQWTADGLAVTTAAGNQHVPVIVADGSNGAFIAWQDYRSGNYDIYVQRLDANGSAQWQADGVVVTDAGGNQISPQLVLSGSSGIILAWEDYRNGNADIYGQRVDNSGGMKWAANGVPVNAANSDQRAPQLVADNAGGAVVVWEDHRTDANTDIYGQRLNAEGTAIWTGNGLAVSSATGNQRVPRAVADGYGGAVAIWEDARNANADIFAQAISANGRQ